MKRIFFVALVAIALLTTNNQVNAQAWEKSSKVLSLGAGASYFFHVNGNNGWGRFQMPITGQLNFQGEFGVHDYVGVGFTTGVGGRAGYTWGGRYTWGVYNQYGYSGEVNIPIGVIANFHFYKLIAEKVSADLHEDKLDIYGGVNVGSGLAFLFGGNTTVVPIAWGGFQVGARYYFTDMFGVNLEAGFGKSIVNGGVVFKL